MVSLREFITEVTGPEPRILAVIGTGCSEGSERISEISYFWDLPVVRFLLLTHMDCLSEEGKNENESYCLCTGILYIHFNPDFFTLHRTR